MNNFNGGLPISYKYLSGWPEPERGGDVVNYQNEVLSNFFFLRFLKPDEYS